MRNRKDCQLDVKPEGHWLISASGGLIGLATLPNVIVGRTANRHDPRMTSAWARKVKLTPRQAEVIESLARVTTDGSRHDPMFWLGEKNVSVQVRSLLAYGLVALENKRLVKTEPAVVAPRTADTGTAVSAMRELLGQRSNC